jgi:hypothetical protein
MDHREISIEYHIHADLERVSGGFLTELEQLGFFADDFAEPRAAFVPRRHYTRKPYSGSEFREVWRNAIALAHEHREEIDGYLEGEVAHISFFSESPVDSTVQLPFVCKLGELPIGSFREDEIHVEFDRDRSDEMVRRALKDMGFRQAFYPYSKGLGVGEIWTVQGTSRQIQLIAPRLDEFLSQLGGMVRGEMDRETVAEFWLSRPDLKMGPVISSIEWL